jgi:hypothetical protein
LMEHYAIYRRPSDYPDKFVVRRFLIAAGKATPLNAVAIVDTLDEARAAIPSGKVNIGRTHGDDPVIAEVWI